MNKMYWTKAWLSSLITVSMFSIALGQENVDAAGSSSEETPAQKETIINAGCESETIFRLPAPFPQQCRRFKDEQYVKLQFDIDGKGRTRNIEVVEYSEKCFVSASVSAVKQWRYSCSSYNSQDVETVMNFKQP